MADLQPRALTRAAYIFASWFDPASMPDLRVVNTDSVANRALVAVIAIMTFMSALAVGAVSMIYSASHDWSASISNEITIQVKPVAGRDVIKDQIRATEIVSKFRGVEKANALSKFESDEILRPWLGAGFEVGDLPIPQLITARISRAEVVDIKALSDALKAELPNSIVDDHRLWRERLNTMSNGLIGIAFFALLLFVLAMGLAVSFATRGALAGSKDIVEVLHFVGASDRFIAREFQRRFLKLGMLGAMIGSGSALCLMWAIGLILHSLTAPSASQIEALFGRMEMHVSIIITLTVVTLVMGAITSAISGIVATSLLKKRLQG